MASKGWICLDRGILAHWVYEDPVIFKIWIWILLNANHEDKKVPIGGELVTVKRGQKFTSIRKIALDVKCSRTKVSRTLNALISDKMVTMERIKSGTLLTIVNYGVYQDVRDSKKPLNDHQSDHTMVQGRDTNNNDYNNDLNKGNKRAAPFSPSETVTIPRVYED